MKLLNAIWYTTKDFPKWFKSEIVKNYKMTKEQRLKIKLDYEKGLAEWEEEQRWENMIIEQEKGIVMNHVEDKNYVPF